MSRALSPADTLALLRDSGALLAGHFRLSSGAHSDSYIQCARALELLRVTLVYYRPQLQYALFGFVGLPDRIHLLIRPSAVIGIEKTLRELKANYSRKYHQFYRRHGSVWQPKYFVREVNPRPYTGRLPGFSMGTPRAQRGQLSGR